MPKTVETNASANGVYITESWGERIETHKALKFSVLRRDMDDEFVDVTMFLQEYEDGARVDNFMNKCESLFMSRRDLVEFAKAVINDLA